MTREALAEQAFYSERADRQWQQLRRKSKAHPPTERVLLTEAQKAAEHEVEAGRKLKYVKQIMADIDSAGGSERERLVALKVKRIDELLEKYAGTKAATEAETLNGKQ